MTMSLLKGKKGRKRFSYFNRYWKVNFTNIKDSIEGVDN